MLFKPDVVAPVAHIQFSYKIAFLQHLARKELQPMYREYTDPGGESLESQLSDGGEDIEIL